MAAAPLLGSGAVKHLLALALALAAGVIGCRRPPPERMTAEEAVLDRQQRGLTALLATAEQGPLMPFEGVLVTVDQALLQQIVSASIPYEQVVAGRYRIAITGAHVELADAFALVRLDGRASLADRPESQAAADVSVYGALDVVELDPQSNRLRGRVSLLALDARRVDVMGVRSAAAEQLVEELGRERLETFAALASSVEIPVRLESTVELPAVASGGVRIAPATLPVAARVLAVSAFRDRLWISIGAGVGEAP